ncbi:hypothetical protein KXS11_11915 [Plantibacter flavus]|uniref:hypothetical protein n=1 Tax=Plantibacter flavus TaxID=150123 RepID=UPI003F18D200
MTYDLSVPARRDIKQISAAIEAAEDGSSVQARLSLSRYGTFDLIGAARRSQIVTGLFVAGTALDQNGKPTKPLQVLESVADLDAVDPDASAVSAQLADLTHGDLVTTRFTDPSYGDFGVTGIAVWSVVGGAFLVGGWLIGAEGSPAPRLTELVRLSPVGEHPWPVPAQITVVGEDIGTD